MKGRRDGRVVKSPVRGIVSWRSRQPSSNRALTVVVHWDTGQVAYGSLRGRVSSLALRGSGGHSSGADREVFLDEYGHETAAAVRDGKAGGRRGRPSGAAVVSLLSVRYTGPGWQARRNSRLAEAQNRPTLPPNDLSPSSPPPSSVPRTLLARRRELVTMVWVITGQLNGDKNCPSPSTPLRGSR